MGFPAASWVVVKGSSMVPLQSLSTPSQISEPDGTQAYSQPGVLGSTSTKPGMQPVGTQVGVPEESSQAPNWCCAVKSQLLPQAPQFLGSFCSLAGSTLSSIWPLQSLSLPSQISTPPLVGRQPPSLRSLGGVRSGSSVR